jgi:release factor glutamine methyltransferase
VNFRQALDHARETLKKRKIEDASLEGEVLLRNILGISRAHLFSHLERELVPEHEAALERALARRLKGEPVAYIIGHHEFYGLDFIIDRNVLIPRPETELLVDIAISLVNHRRFLKIADIGTGSGAIAVSLAVNLPGVTVYATDISAGALKVAAKNVTKHGVEDRVILLPGNLLEPLPVKVDLVIANLPYVRAAEIPGEGPLSHEPALALDGGEDGLAVIRPFSRQVRAGLNKKGCLLLEIGQGQAKAVRTLLRNEFPGAEIRTDRDLSGIERSVTLCLT